MGQSSLCVSNLRDPIWVVPERSLFLRWSNFLSFLRLKHCWQHFVLWVCDQNVVFILFYDLAERRMCEENCFLRSTQDSHLLNQEIEQWFYSHSLLLICSKLFLQLTWGLLHLSGTTHFRDWLSFCARKVSKEMKVSKERERDIPNILNQHFIINILGDANHKEMPLPHFLPIAISKL